MSEARVLRLIALGFFNCAVAAGFVFFVSGLNVFWLFGFAVLLMGAFMSFLVSFAA